VNAKELQTVKQNGEALLNYLLDCNISQLGQVSQYNDSSSVLYSSQNDSVAHPTSYPMMLTIHLIGSEDESEWSYASTLPYVSRT
jgi:hypothetical protein